ncbi:putative tetratricopeptide-like helical domain superfamily [Helianthus annuus]|nr:putative tetratricopeptide-like helical domain superfamily [Helianthus annuus]
MADEAPAPQNLAPSASVEATIDSIGFGGTSSSCNNNHVAETSGLTSDVEGENSLAYAQELMDRGSKANKEEDYAEAADCFSRALEIRAAHYGELSPECVRSYYKYGCALLYKAQEESDPLVSGSVSKKEVSAEHGSDKGAESGDASVSSKAKEVTSNAQDGGDEDQEEDDEASDADEDESDLDLAWKMLDVARAIAEKQPGDTMEKVDILSALAEVALEREDVDTSLSDYLKALSMLERLAEPDSRHLAELNFRICLCLEIASKGEEAIPYCQKAISVCKARLQRLKNEIESSSGTVPPGNAESAVLNRQSSSASQTADSVADKEKEIEILTGLASELEKKASSKFYHMLALFFNLEDLQQAASNPSNLLSDILGMIAAKGKGGQTSGVGGSNGGQTSSRIGMMSNSSGFESPTVSTAHTNSDSVSSAEPPAKKPTSDPAGGSH